jgi:hypothetical protein
LVSLEEFLLALKARKTEPPIEPNFFSIGGRGYLENPTSDLMAIFMGGDTGTPSWLARALVECLKPHYATDIHLLEQISWSEVRAAREVSHLDSTSGTHKRLDLVVSNGNFVLGIENKIYAGAEGNPFHIYDELLDKHESSGLKLRCILHPTGNVAGLDQKNSHWHVISYEALAKKAFELIANDVRIEPISKWLVFYQEFLSHLQSLGTPTDTQIMNHEDFSFAIKHFQELEHAQNLITNFQKELQRQANASITKALNSSLAETKIHNWGTGGIALRFFPKTWGKESNVAFVYLNENGAIGFKTIVYIRSGETTQAFSTIKTNFANATIEAMCAWKKGKKDLYWEESNGSWLALSVVSKNQGLEHDLFTLGEISLWAQQNIFLT